ncbi:hypothetical protein [Chryseolinea lacunae]|uniref:Uncharacterized protein n=1 Tax=Chryseolinea lacunae TaxID=2801331 RepID=A0ABS1KWX1_9BACT|nr:hypothetical protein [Chryseolinea lacunae]MBL0743762.1 hypothetical protein [Chryseolinea lacunae]
MRGRNGKRFGISGAMVMLLMMGCLTQAFAQFPSELWHEGKIVLVEGDTLKGLVKYDLPQNLVQYTARDNRTEAFSARKVLFFEIYDTSVRRYRQFFALPYMGMGTGADYKAPIFFELLTEGKMTLLCRESLETRMYNSSPYYGGYYNNSYSRVVLVHTYYLLDENGNISEFTGNKSDLLQRMGKKSEEVEKYMKENRLKYDDPYDFVRIVAYYNSLM